MGHVRDLPKSQLGVDPKKNFKPKYVVSPTKKKVLDELKKAAEKVDILYIATDPDREGEAIGWHLAEELDVAKKNVFRITFNEITERAVKAAFNNPGKIDLKKVDAQQARRVLDRLVGYSLSPLLWEKVQRGLSAGRVQSVAVRLIVDREREVQAFVPVEYWSLHARLNAARPPEFVATLKEIEGEKASLANEETTRALMASLDGAPFVVKSVTRGERRRNPAPPFITSTLQQEAGKKLGFTARKTMTIAQQLYEGIDLGSEGADGLCPGGARGAGRSPRLGHRAHRHGVRARSAADVSLAGERPGGARGDPPFRAAERAKERGALPHQGPAGTLPARVGTVPGEPDDAGGLRHRERRHRGRPVPLPGPGRNAQVQGLHRRLRGKSRGGRRPARVGPGGRDAPAGERRSADAARPRPETTLHPAASALHGGLADQGARGARDRATIDVRVDPGHDHQRSGLRASRAAYAVADRAGHGGHRQAHPVLPGHHERRVHRPDGRQPRQDRGGRAQVGRHGKGVLRALQARPRARQARDAEREGGRAHWRAVPRVRQRAPGQARPLREVPGVLRVPRLPIHPQPRRDGPRRGRAGQRELPRVRPAHGDQARTLWQVHRLLRLPGVQDDEAGDPRHRVSRAGLRGPARGASLTPRAHLFRLLGVSELQVRGLAATRA